jgi:hypothetical protein
MVLFTYAALYSITLRKIDNVFDTSITNWRVNCVRNYKFKTYVSPLTTMTNLPVCSFQLIPDIASITFSPMFQRVTE